MISDWEKGERWLIFPMDISVSDWDLDLKIFGKASRSSG